MVFPKAFDAPCRNAAIKQDERICREGGRYRVKGERASSHWDFSRKPVELGLVRSRSKFASAVV